MIKNMAARRKIKWRKILYEHQNVPDNYVDDSFLDEMKKNCKTIFYKNVFHRN